MAVKRLLLDLLGGYSVANPTIKGNNKVSYS